ncbi:MAG: thiamine pyrophosphate-dependent dehydrogenase E1 component subunit alpha [Candidatus Lokiarchaeota archaeon]|nr:thiamine pyrophosphate-dependent dehydrogenase E1 component subunit alpha [Candidatus Lokiarchaeota archaeon]
MAEVEIWQLYRSMLRSRLFENAVKELWEKGKISGEMHLGTGEEAIMAGVVSQLEQGDAIAVDHRGTPPFIIRGIDPILLLLEFLGHPKGLCAGQGGHMHLFSKEHLIASSGIVGSSGPAATGFALALRYKKQGNIAVAFFGEGAINQGMMLESMNLASIWNLPVLFVCKDNDWAVTTITNEVTGGNLIDRAKGFGIEGYEVDGTDVEAVWKVTNEAISKIRNKGGPQFIHAHCVHTEGHLLGDPLLRYNRNPNMLAEVANSLKEYAGKSLDEVLLLLRKIGGQVKKRVDPIVIIQKKLKNDPDRLKQIDEEVTKEIEQIINKALEIFEGGMKND